MARDVVSAKLDIIFKKIFTDNKDMLHSFVADMLDVPQESISDIILTNPEIPPESPEGKFSRLDLNMKVDNRLVNVEIQLKNDTDYRDRTLFYWAKLYSSELKSGEDYSELKQTITINSTAYDVDGSVYMEDTQNAASFVFTNSTYMCIIFEAILKVNTQFLYKVI